MKTVSNDSLIEIGVIGRPHGVRGEVHVSLFNTTSDLVDTLDRVLVRSSAGEGWLAIEGIRRAPRSLLCSFTGVVSREAAKRLQGGLLLVERSLLPRPAEGEFYVVDLVGMEAWDAGTSLGRVISSRGQAGVEIAAVRGDDSEVEVPLVEDYVTAVDFERGRLELHDTALLPRSSIRRK